MSKNCVYVFFDGRSTIYDNYKIEETEDTYIISGECGTKQLSAVGTYPRHLTAIIEWPDGDKVKMPSNRKFNVVQAKRKDDLE